MTEEEWLKCVDPQRMFEFVRSKASERKRRLFAVECCRIGWEWLEDQRSRQAVDLAERVAEGHSSERERNAAWSTAREAVRAIRNPVEEYQWVSLSVACLADAAVHAIGPAHQLTRVVGAMKSAEKHGWRPLRPLSQRLPDLLRELVGNPFRPVTIDPAWRTPTVISLAQGVYDERAFDRLPILADALEDAGCTNAEMLNHCRQPGEHVRGCFVVDLLLGKQ